MLDYVEQINVRLTKTVRALDEPIKRSALYFFYTFNCHNSDFLLIFYCVHMDSGDFRFTTHCVKLKPAKKPRCSFATAKRQG